MVYNELFLIRNSASHNSVSWMSLNRQTTLYCYSYSTELNDVQVVVTVVVVDTVSDDKDLLKERGTGQDTGEEKLEIAGLKGWSGRDWGGAGLGSDGQVIGGWIVITTQISGLSGRWKLMARHLRKDGGQFHRANIALLWSKRHMIGILPCRDLKKIK